MKCNWAHLYKMILLTNKPSWDPKEYSYEVLHSPPIQDVNALDKYIFVIRKRISKLRLR